MAPATALMLFAAETDAFLIKAGVFFQLLQSAENFTHAKLSSQRETCKSISALLLMQQKSCEQWLPVDTQLNMTS